MMCRPNATKILVFLPQAAGNTIVSMLSKRGYDSVMVSTVPAAFDALRSDDFAFAITTRSDIDLVRNIRALPVLNLEVFFHAGISSGGVQANSKRFDSKAFLDRVEFLTRPAARTEVGGGPATSRPRRVRPAYWWTLATTALRFAQNRKATPDVRS